MEERETFDGWNKILTNKEVAVSDITDLCSFMLKDIEGQFKNLDNSREKTERLVLLYTVYASLRDLIERPATERQNLITYLTKLL